MSKQKYNSFIHLLKQIKTPSLIVCTVFFILFLLYFSSKNLSSFYSFFAQKEISTQQIVPEEISAIKNTTNRTIQAAIYRKLIEKQGPEEAQLALYKSGLPFDGETHLLNHTVGDWLYEKHGNAGIIHCKDYFLSSCYHGFLLHVIAKDGISGLDEVMQKCWDVGHPTATQCAHGIGHGLLAYEDYANLPQALLDCDAVSTTSKDFPLYNCHDGVFMENLWAVHNDGKPSPARWIKAEDPLYPCNDPQIGEAYRKACWSNQPHVMFQLFRGDIKKVANECLKLTDNVEYQWTCFDSLSRQLHPMTKNNIDAVFGYCANMPTEHWTDQCVFSIVRAYYSVGDRSIPYQICASMPPNKQLLCGNELTKVMKAYFTR